jgi:hypothetical protein
MKSKQKRHGGTEKNLKKKSCKRVQPGRKPRSAKQNPLFSRSEKRRFKNKARKKVKAGARSLFSRIFNVPLSKGLGGKAPSSRKRRSTSKPAEENNDVFSALLNLGYKRDVARSAASQARSGNLDHDIRHALGLLSKRNPAPKHRRNGTSEDEETRKARKVFRGFHQADPDKVTTVTEKLHDAGKYALLGRLFRYEMQSGHKLECWDANINLTSDPDARQLFLWGGNQDLEHALRSFGVRSRVQLVDLGEIKKIWYVAQKGMHNFQPTEYHHRFGEDGGQRPRLMYDRKNKKQFIVGGDYKIESRGIVN